ncbi:MAG: hypothetical protein QG670_223 [Thermoproteota archaeon]|nr:hypothetical protein [Thermoproteota archaeon]
MIILVLVTMAIFLFGGGLYDIVNSPLSNPGMSSGEIQAYMDAVYDSISLMLFQVIGVGGGFLAYRSTRYAYRPREARMFLLIGVTLLFIGFTGAELLLLMKGA